jgi:hypothetical protein
VIEKAPATDGGGGGGGGGSGSGGGKGGGGRRAAASAAEAPQPLPTQTLQEWLSTTPHWFAGFLERQNLMDEWTAISCISKAEWVALVATAASADVGAGAAGGEPAVVEAQCKAAKLWAANPWTITKLREFQIIAAVTPAVYKPADVMIEATT